MDRPTAGTRPRPSATRARRRIAVLCRHHVGLFLYPMEPSQARTTGDRPAACSAPTAQGAVVGVSGRPHGPDWLLNLAELRMRRSAPPSIRPSLRSRSSAGIRSASVAHQKTSRSSHCFTFAFALFIGLFVATAGGIAQTSSTPTFSGQARVVQATVPPLSPITVADTGPLPSSGGAQEASLLDVPPISLGTVGALNGADVAHATTIGRGNASRSEASVADVSLTAAGNTIAADFLMSEASAQCKGTSPSVSGRSDLARLVINDQRIDVSGATNQTVQLPLNAGSVVINEQSSSVNGQSGTMDVNALHVVVNNATPGSAPLADVIISHAHSDITCPASPPACDPTAADFVPGGGWCGCRSAPTAQAN